MSTTSSPVPSPASPAANPRPPLIDLQGLDVSLLDAVTGSRRRVLTNASLTLGEGRIVGLTGQSGGGKSTLALAVSGQLPESARCFAKRWAMFGQPLSPRSIESRLRRWPATSLFLISQDARSSLVPYQNVAWHLRQADRTARRTANPAEHLDLLLRLGFEDPQKYLSRLPRQMSSGECQRIQFAMACRVSPRILIADEPFASVQPSLSRLLGQELRTFVARGSGVLLVSHDLRMLAEVGDTVSVVWNGQVVESGAARQVLDAAAPHHPQTANLLRSESDVPYAQFVPKARPLPPVAENGPSPASSSANQESHRTLCRASGICKTFRIKDHQGNSHGILSVHHRDLEIRSGQRIGLLGESGVGKTTFARILMGLIDADAGTIQRFPQIDAGWTQTFSPPCRESTGIASSWWNGVKQRYGPRRETSACPRRDQLWERMQLSYQDTDLVFDPAASLGESLTQVIRSRRPHLSARIAWDIADDLLARFQLPPRLLKAVSRQMSGGERRRASIARTLAALGFPRHPADDGREGSSEERLLILDEPTVGIDVFVQCALAETLLQAQSEMNLTFLVISHDERFVNRFCDKVVTWRRPDRLANPPAP